MEHRTDSMIVLLVDRAKKPVRLQIDVSQAFNLILSALYLMGKTGTRNKGKTYGLPDPIPVFHIKLPYAP